MEQNKLKKHPNIVKINKEKQKNQHQITILGIPIVFPFKPYKSQIQYIEGVLKSLKNNQHSLLESPTGTGKTLSLLTSTIAYMRKNPDQNIQIVKQLVGQLKKTVYEPKITCLGARFMYCIHPKVKKLKGKKLNEKCKELCYQEDCGFQKEGERLAGKYDYQIRDIEEIKEYGQNRSGCPYFLSQTLTESCDVVFAPYAYALIQPLVDRLKKSGKKIVLIFDEAHNLSDQAEQFQSFEISFEDCNNILDIIGKDGKMRSNLQNLKQKMDRRNLDFENLSEYCEGVDYLANIVENIQGNLKMQSGLIKNSVSLDKNIDKQHILVGFENSKKIVQNIFGSGYSFYEIKIIFSLVDKIYEWQKKKFKKIHIEIEDFMQFLTKFKYVEQYNRAYNLFLNYHNTDERKLSFQIQCYEPRVIFDYIQNTLRNTPIILTSGSLKPLDDWQEQLGIKFANIVSCDHVIKASQIQGAIIKKTSRQNHFEFSHKNRIQKKIINQMYINLGYLLLDELKLIPNGVVLFFSSYSLLQQCLTVWQKEMYHRLNRIKKIYIEPQCQKQITKTFLDYQVQAINKKGALLFATARGRLGEGIDFTDELARAVYLIGCPNLQTEDLYVRQKQKYLNFCYGKQQGKRWYENQSIRTMNQCLGRVIRHQNDYGSVFLVDARFNETKFKQNISDWIREQVTVINNQNQHEKMLQGLPQFYRKNKEGEDNLYIQELSYDDSTEVYQELEEQLSYRINEDNEEYFYLNSTEYILNKYIEKEEDLSYIIGLL